MSLRRRVLALEEEMAALRAKVDSGTFDAATREALENLVVAMPIALRVLRREQLADQHQPPSE